jgi:hypothetical protein
LVQTATVPSGPIAGSLSSRKSSVSRVATPVGLDVFVGVELASDDGHRPVGGDRDVGQELVVRGVGEPTNLSVPPAPFLTSARFGRIGAWPIPAAAGTTATAR